jgi:hypothetical protein
MSSSPSDLKLVIIAVATLTVLAIAGAVIAPADNHLETRASTFNSAPDGAKAAYLLLERLGYRVERSFVPLSELRSNPRETTLVIASPVARFAAADRRALEGFVRDGGVVLATGAVDDLLPGVLVLPLETLDVGTAPSPVTALAAAPSDLTARRASLSLIEEARAQVKQGGYVAVYRTPESPAVLSAWIGQGRVIWWSGSTPLLNESIAAPENAGLLLDVVGPLSGRRIVWDEYSHGHQRSPWSYVARTPVPALFVQAAMIGLVALSRHGRRFVPVRVPRAEPRTSTLEFVDSMGTLYHRAGAAAGALETCADRFRRVLCRATGLPVTTSDEQIAAATSRLGLSGREVAKVLSASRTAAGSPETSTRTALALVRQMQTVAAALRPTRTQDEGSPGGRA